MTEASMTLKPILTRISTDTGYKRYAFLLPEPTLMSSKRVNILSSASVKLEFDRPLTPTNSEAIKVNCIFKQIVTEG
jgi:hypothetical protein